MEVAWFTIHSLDLKDMGHNLRAEMYLSTEVQMEEHDLGSPKLWA